MAGRSQTKRRWWTWYGLGALGYFVIPWFEQKTGTHRASILIHKAFLVFLSTMYLIGVKTNVSFTRGDSQRGLPFLLWREYCDLPLFFASGSELKRAGLVETCGGLQYAQRFTSVENSTVSISSSLSLSLSHTFSRSYSRPSWPRLTRLSPINKYTKSSLSYPTAFPLHLLRIKRPTNQKDQTLRDHLQLSNTTNMRKERREEKKREVCL